MQAGVGLVPEERRAEGLILNKSIAFNFGLANLQRLRVAPALPLIRMSQRSKLATTMMQQLQVKAPNAETPVGRLSGGNQQKVVIGKWLSRRPRVLILDEPTRGVDIGARAEIHRLIRNLAAEGVAVIVISSEAEELPEVCDRVLIMAEGRVVRELAGAEMTRANIVAGQLQRSACPTSGPQRMTGPPSSHTIAIEHARAQVRPRLYGPLRHDRRPAADDRHLFRAVARRLSHVSATASTC